MQELLEHALVLYTARSHGEARTKLTYHNERNEDSWTRAKHRFRFRNVVYKVAVPICIDRNVYRHASTWLGNSIRVGLLRWRLVEIAHPEDAPYIEKAFCDAREEGKTYSIQHRIIRPDNGQTRYIHALGEVEYSRDTNRPVRVIGTAQDITEHKQAEEEAQRLLAEKETLLKEVHHRLKNNLAQVESLLSIQADSADSADVKSALNKAIFRVGSTRTLYEKLIVGESYEEVPMRAYLESLIDSLVKVFNERCGVTVERRIVDFALEPKKAVPVGIIINELLTNVFKYAFAGRAEGHVSIDLEKTEKKVALTITDDGVGSDKGVDANNTPGFGLSLVKMLAEQLGGTFTNENNNGTRSVLEFEI